MPISPHRVIRVGIMAAQFCRAIPIPFHKNAGEERKDLGEGRGSSKSNWLRMKKGGARKEGAGTGAAIST